MLGLRNDPEFGGGGTDAEHDGPTDAANRAIAADPIQGLLEGASSGTTEPTRDAVAAEFLSRLKVTRVRVTLLLEIKFSSTDAEKAAKIANAIAEVYLRDQVEEKQRAAGYASDLLERKIEELKRRAEQAERRVEEFKAENNIFDSSGAILSEKQLTQQMSQTMDQRNATAAAKVKYEQVQKLMASGEGINSIAEVLQNPGISSRKDALAAATRKEAELETRYGPKHPEMMKIRAEVAEAAAQLNAEIQRVLANLKNEYEVAIEKDRELNTNFTSLKEQQAQTREAGVTLVALQREANTEKQLLEALLSRYKTTNETQDLQLPDSRIVERATVPLSPSSPKRKQIMILAVLAGLGLGIAVALALEFFTRGIVRSEDIEHTLQLSHLSSIPAIAARQSTGGANASLRTLRMILAEPRSAFTEAIRAARREIDARAKPGTPRIILVASSLASEDADIIASNLAHQYAALGSKVLLVDGDLRRAALTKRLVPSAMTGLLEVLNRNIDFETAVLRDATTNLNFMPAMRDSSLDISSPEMLASARMAAVFTFMKRQFDTIVVCAPPLLPVVDGRLLADHADQIVFVMSWKSTPKELARRALKLLGYSQGKVAGVILNRVDPSELTVPHMPAGEPVLTMSRQAA
jgi:uncharacterized protein involved in exopolysaccharide biosynthesis/Mrp family chromosome partitioning ATPase